MRVIDAARLSEWLGASELATRWFHGFTGRASRIDAQHTFATWAGKSQPALTRRVVLNGRETLASRLLERIEKPGITFAQAQTQEEALAFITATIGQPDSAVDARTAILSDESDFERLIAQRQDIVIVTDFPYSGSYDPVASGHHVIIPTTSDGRRSRNPDVLEITPLSPDGVALDLRSLGLGGAQAGRLALASAGDLALLIKILRNERGLPPSRAGVTSPAVLGLLLVGALDPLMESDWKVLERVSGTSGVQNEQALSDELANTPSHLVEHERALMWRARRASWLELGHRLSRQLVERFCSVAEEVLTERDPGLDLEPSERWMAAVHSKVHTCSVPLRRGVAHGLALLAVESELLRPPVEAVAKRRVRDATRKILASDDVERWLSIGSHLAVLAEAAPDEFLSAAERALTKQGGLGELFEHESSGISHSAPHVYVVWALQICAASPVHLARAAVLLAVLSLRDPGGKTGPRPFEALVDLFCPWFPQTAAPANLRVAALDSLCSRFPELGVKLLSRLLPGTMPQSVSAGGRSKFRRWTDEIRPVARDEVSQQTTWSEQRIRQIVATHPDSWPKVVGHLDKMSLEASTAALDLLQQTLRTKLSNQTEAAVFDQLRRLLHQHRKFPGARWALPPRLVEQAASIYSSLNPSCVVSKYAWLFGNHPRIPNPSPHRKGESNWQKEQATVAQLQREALQEIGSREGYVADIWALARACETPFVLGFRLAESWTAKQFDDLFDNPDVERGEPHRVLVLQGYTSSVYSERADSGGSWIHDRLKSIMDSHRDDDALHTALALPFTSETWRLLWKTSRRLTNLYWGKVQPIALPTRRSDAVRAVKRLIKAQRYRQAFRLVAARIVGSHGTESLPPGIVIAALEGLARADKDEEPTVQFSAGIGYYVESVLEYLDGKADTRKLAALEFQFIDVFRGGARGRQPKHLGAAVGASPSLFASLVCMVFRASENEEAASNDADLARAHSAYSFLRGWDCRPVVGESCTHPDLRSWVLEARRLLHERDRAAIGDQELGRILARWPRDDNGMWPGEGARELLELIGSDDLELGVAIERYNSRGVVMRDPTRGGVAQHHAAQVLRENAESIAHQYRTAAMLRRIADDAEREATSEDEWADRLRIGSQA